MKSPAAAPANSMQATALPTIDLPSTDLATTDLAGNSLCGASAYASIGLTELERWKSFAAVLVICLGVIRVLPAIGTTNLHNDFSHYYVGGTLFASGQSAYTSPLRPMMEERGLPYDASIPYAAHPPLILLAMSLLSHLPIETAYYLWLAVQIGATAASVELARRILDRQWTDSAWLLLVGLMLNSISFQMLIYYSQVQLIVASGLYLAFWLGQQKRHHWACAAITLVSAFKIYPVILAPWIFFRGLVGWKDAAGRLTAMACTSIACLSLPGLHTWLDFVFHGVPALTNNAEKWCNYSIQNFWPMLGRTVPAIEDIASLLAPMTGMLALVLAYVLAYRLRRSPLHSFSIVLVATMFCGVITWSHYLTVLLLPIGCVLLGNDILQNGCADREGMFKQWPVFVAVAAVLAIMMPKIDCLILDLQPSTLRLFVHFYPLYAAIILCGLLSRRPESATQPIRV